MTNIANPKSIFMEVLEAKPVSSSMVLLKLQCCDSQNFYFKSGQCTKWFRKDGGSSVFAVASEPEEKKFVELLVKIETYESYGAPSIGDLISISAPFGPGFPIERFKEKNIILIGMGTALAPLRSVLKGILRKDHLYGKLTLVYGIRTPEELPFKDEFEIWSLKISLFLAFSRAQPVEHGIQGRVTDLIHQLKDGLKDSVVCICGSPEMESEVIKLLESAGVSKENIFLNH